MTSRRVVRRLALIAGGSAAACMGVLALSSGAAVAGPLQVPLTPTTSTAPSVAPANPVDCTDPNNQVNCQTPPIDSPLVSGTAAPGSPFRD